MSNTAELLVCVCVCNDNERISVHEFKEIVDG